MRYVKAFIDEALSWGAAIALACAMLAGMLAVAGGLSGCSGSDNSNSNSSSSNTTTATSTSSNSNTDSSDSSDDVITSDDISGEYASGLHHAVIQVEGYDPITVELDADSAPVTVWNFCALANEGFYDGLSFYRFVDGFCMQGGSSNYSAADDPDSDEKCIVGEFSANGIDNPLADDFERGTIAMARSTDKDSASTTFFVTLKSGASVSASLDKNYAAFGKVEAGDMATVDKIVEDYLPKVDDSSNDSITDKAQQAIITSITITD